MNGLGVAGLAQTKGDAIGDTVIQQPSAKSWGFTDGPAALQSHSSRMLDVVMATRLMMSRILYCIVSATEQLGTLYN